MLTTLITPVTMALGSEDGEVPRHSPFVVTLGDSDRTKLEVRARKYTSLYRDAIRAKKPCSWRPEGYRIDVIAARLDTPRQIVSTWRKRFFE